MRINQGNNKPVKFKNADEVQQAILQGKIDYDTIVEVDEV